MECLKGAECFDLKIVEIAQKLRNDKRAENHLEEKKMNDLNAFTLLSNQNF